MTEKLTMAAIWEELTPEERKAFAMMVGCDQGQLALTKLSAALKAVMYRYYNKALIEQNQADVAQQQIEMMRQQHKHELKQMEYEMRRRYEQRTYASDNTLGNEFDRMRKMYGW